MFAIILLALLLLASSATADKHKFKVQHRRKPPVPLRVLHLNDNHARFESVDTAFNTCKSPETCFGGFAKVATAVKQKRAGFKGDTLAIHAGDQISGTIWDFYYTRQNNQVAPKFLNKLKLDVFVPGNHEFDFGPTILASFINELSAPVVSCNVDVSKEPALKGLIKRFIVKRLPKSGLKVGIIGFTPADTGLISSGGPSITFVDPSSVAAKCIRDAKKAGAEMILAVAHVGLTVDRELAETFSQFDAIIGGHSHSFLYTGAVPALLKTPVTNETALVEGDYPMIVKSGKKEIPIATAYWGSRYLGVLDLDFTEGKGVKTRPSSAPFLLGDLNSTNPVEDDPEVKAEIDLLKVPLDALTTAVIGSSSVPLNGARPDIRQQETNLANLITDAVLWYITNSTNIISGSPDLPYMAVFNGGGIRASIAAGPITRGNVITVLPFGNLLVVKRMSAATLKSALNGALGSWNAVGGSFPHVGRAKYSFNPTNTPGSILKRAVLNSAGAEVDIDSVTGDVLVLTNDFLAKGGDGYPFNAEPLVLDTSISVDQIVIEYITAFSPVAPALDGRIANCNVDPAAALCA